MLIWNIEKAERRENKRVKTKKKKASSSKIKIKKRCSLQYTQKKKKR
jgi:hypothetical protein